VKGLDGKVALVTGGAAGIGEGIARRLAEEGAVVLIADLDIERGQALAEDIGGSCYEHDVTRENDWTGLLDEVEKRHGGLQVLVNNAGIGGPFAGADPEVTALPAWRLVQQVNVEGAFLGSRAALPVIRRSGGGSIVNVSSTAA